MSSIETKVLSAVGLAVFGLFLIVSKVDGGVFFFCLAVAVTWLTVRDTHEERGGRYRARQNIHRAIADNLKPAPKRVIHGGNYAAMGRDITSKSDSKRKRKVLPSNTPRKVLVMLQNDLNQALRLYEGVARRNPDMSSDWVWERVVSDLERDRR